MAADSTQRAEKETARTVIPLNPRLTSPPQPRVSNARSWEEAAPGLAWPVAPAPVRGVRTPRLAVAGRQGDVTEWRPET